MFPQKKKRIKLPVKKVVQHRMECSSGVVSVHQEVQSSSDTHQRHDGVKR